MSEASDKSRPVDPDYVNPITGKRIDGTRPPWAYAGYAGSPPYAPSTALVTGDPDWRRYCGSPRM